MEKIPLIIDTDPGVDDAVALMMAFNDDNFDIKLISSTAGNLGINLTTRNCLHLTKIFDRENILVSEGANKPLKRKLVDAENVHGKMGFGKYEYDTTYISKNLSKNKAYEDMASIISNSKQKITIIALAPLTNIAHLILEHNEVIKNIDKIVFMGGSLDFPKDNKVPPYNEFNIGVDPESAEVVFNSKIPLVMIPMELGHGAYLSFSEIEKTKETNKTGELLSLMYDGYKDTHVKNGAAMHDGATIAYLINNNLYETKKAKIYVKYFDSIKTGTLMIDYDSKDKNATIAIKIDIEKFKELYFNLLKKSKIVLK
jgi:non-specific riboncleoside hydrolase